MEKEWKKEVARDILALGSWVFFVLVIARAAIKPYRPFLDELIIAGVIILVIGFMMKYDGYVARGMVVAVLTSIFYNSLIYSIFAGLAFVLLFISAFYTGRNQRKIYLGFVIGALTTAISYFIMIYLV